VNPAQALPLSFFIVALFAIGMALSFFAADPRSPTSRALASTLGLLGATMLLNVPLQLGFVGVPGQIWTRVFSLLEGAIIIAALEWILRIARTETHKEPRSLFPPRAIIPA
jgi:hypothetical protein